MAIRNILMVEPKAPGKHVFSLVRLPRLGLPVLGTLASRQGYAVRVVIEELGGLDLRQVREADLVCISTITSTAPAAYRLADHARLAGVPVVLGGAHVTFLPDEALEHADWVIRGEAEHSFLRLLDMLAGRCSPESVPGLSWRRAGQTIHNPLPSEPVDMAAVPVPDFSLLGGSGPVRFDRGVIPVQTSRGCPHRCQFCSVTSMFGHRMRYASCERVAEALESGRSFGSKVFFYDDNFCASPERTKTLLDHLLTRNVFLPIWFAQVSVQAADDLELLALMRRAHCHTVFVGFESVQDDSLAAYHKRQSVEDIRRAIRRFKAHDIWVHGMFVSGSDVDTPETIRATSRFAREEDIDTIQILVLTPLPGSAVFDQMQSEGRLLTRDWSFYDAHHAVFRPARMTPHALMESTMAAMARFYSRRRILGKLVRGQLLRTVFNLYARRQVRRWFRENRALLRTSRRATGGDPYGLGVGRDLPVER